MARKERTQNPQEYSNYKKYKPYLRIEFNHQCAYCLVNEGALGGSKSFHIDHYKPKSKFPLLSAVYSNLFYTCRDCNTYKGDYWNKLFSGITREFIINPCDHDPDIHLERSNKIWKGLTKTGKWNIKKLRLNSPRQIKIRDEYLTMQDIIKDIETNKEKFKKEASYCKLPQDQEKHLKLCTEIEKIDRKLDVIKSKIRGPVD